MDIRLKAGKLLFIISLWMVTDACRSRQEQPKTDQQEEVKEHPKPGTEAQTDSLKRVLDEKRKARKGN